MGNRSVDSIAESAEPLGNLMVEELWAGFQRDE
jgi:hypothetical protein